MSTVRTSVSGGVAHVVLDRPPLNVLDIPTSRALAAAFRRAGGDSRTRVIVLSGRGKCFSAGVDIRDHTRARVRGMLAAFHRAVRALMALDKPVIASVHGHCLGGGMELALAADFVVARPGTRFALPEITLACFPPVAAALLPSRLGRQRAADLILLGEGFGVKEAQTMGLVSTRSEADLLKRLLSLSPDALACAKAAMRRGSLAGAEAVYLKRLVHSRQMEEGVKAFLEKRTPQW